MPINHILALSVVVLLFLFFKYGFKKQRQQPVVYLPQENIIYQFDYWLKLIRKAASDSEIDYLTVQITEYEYRFIDHPDVKEYADSLRDELQMRCNELYASSY